MRLDVDNQRDVLNAYRCLHATVIADGRTITDATIADDETGEIVYYARDDEGRLILDPDRDQMLLRTLWAHRVEIIFDDRYDPAVAERLAS